MTRARTLTLAVVAFAAIAAHASWYDDYDAGLVAVRRGNWALAAQKMSAAIAGNPKEDNKSRTYGAIFINYHPYYYRGVANLNLGRYEQAIADLERTSGPGPENLGSIDMLIQMAKTKLEASRDVEPVQPPPTQTVAPVRPPVTQTTPPPPQLPQIDPALRARATSAINAAKARLSAAQQRRATASPQYQQATSMVADAATRNATAKSNDDLNAIISIAENAATIADLATAPGVPPPVTPTRPVSAADAVLADYKPLLRNALEDYFAGEFESAARSFEDLSRKLPNNGWIYAFLGASQYSVYAFEADVAYKNAAERSFRKAKQYGRFKNGLPEKYFSRRIRKAFRETAG